jgi:uncharacterized protein YyaL (SSP411 family)
MQKAVFFVRFVAFAALVGACAPAMRQASAPSRQAVREAPRADLQAPDRVSEAPAWAELTPATFARAKAEGRFIVLDGAAEWCHWCHVMEATTYRDPAVTALLRERFIAVKVDVDSRPDLEERYEAYGWPATVVFSPDGEEIGKYRGYIEPDRFAEILRAVLSSAKGGAKTQKSADAEEAKPLSEDHLAWIARRTELDLDDYYDDKEGGWGDWQKAPLAWNNAWALGHQQARALFTLDKQRAVLDPVWGGVYQYSAGKDWTHPHFEKLMTVQAGAIDNYARAYLVTKDARWLETARSIERYVARFMTSKDGGFYTTQDADLNAHDMSKPFLDGHAYYAKLEGERLALGLPRIDTHEYARENGLTIAAYATLYEATKDQRAREVAERAAKRILATHANDRGGVAHDATPKADVLFLADNAAFAWGLVRLSEATGDAQWKEHAARIVGFAKSAMLDDKGGGFFATTPDANAVGAFAARRKPFEDNVMMLRVLVRLGNERDTIAKTLRAIATPDEIKGRGRSLGDFLLALEETRDAR